MKWLYVEYEHKLVQKTFTMYEFIDFLELIEEIVKDERKQRWLENLSKERGKPHKITLMF